MKHYIVNKKIKGIEFKFDLDLRFKVITITVIDLIIAAALIKLVMKVI